MLYLMKVELTPEQKMTLEKNQRLNHDKRVCDRIRCVLLSAEGWSTKMIAQSQRIHETTVLRHINDYLTSEKLSSENGGSHEHLSVAQTDELIQFLIENTQVTTQAIIALPINK